MKCIVKADSVAYINNEHKHYRFEIYQSGSRTYLEVTTARDSYFSNACESFSVELCRDERKVQVEDSFLQHTDLFNQMTNMIKNAQGMWQPKFQAGDVVMVDKPGSNTVKIIDPTLQTSETLEKKQVIIDKDDCSCGIKTLMQLGCSRKRGYSACGA